MKRKNESRNTTDARSKLLNSALELANDTLWANISLADIAIKAGVSDTELSSHFKTKYSFIKAFNQLVENEILDQLQGVTFDSSERDNLFEFVMVRFDVFAPYKSAIKNILGGALPFDLSTSLLGIHAAKQSISKTLSVTGIKTESLCGRLRINGLLAIYLKTFLIWLNDDTAECSKTMASLDTSLRRAERVSQMIPFNLG